MQLAGYGTTTADFINERANYEGIVNVPCFGDTGPNTTDVWYTFTAPLDGRATFSVKPFSPIFVVPSAFEIYDGCGGSLLACEQGGSFEVFVDMEAGESVKLRALRDAVASRDEVQLTFEQTGCGPADFAEPFGVLDLGDIDTFIAAFQTQNPAADIAPAFGVIDLDDIDSFITAFLAGCP